MTRQQPFLVILDRDGILIKHVHHLSNSYQVEYFEEAFDVLRSLQKFGAVYGIATNQSVVGRGLATRDEVDQINQSIMDTFKSKGVLFTAIKVCPHRPDEGCDCRKPAPRMAREILQLTGISKERAIMIGDQESDVAFAHSSGIKAIILNPSLSIKSNADYICTSWAEIEKVLINFV